MILGNLQILLVTVMVSGAGTFADAADSRPAETRPVTIGTGQPPREFAKRARRIKEENKTNMGRYVELAWWKKMEPNREKWAFWFDRWERSFSRGISRLVSLRESVWTDLRHPDSYKGINPDIADFGKAVDASLSHSRILVDEWRKEGNKLFNEDGIKRASWANFEWLKVGPDLVLASRAYLKWMVDAYPKSRGQVNEKMRPLFEFMEELDSAAEQDRKEFGDQEDKSRKTEEVERKKEERAAEAKRDAKRREARKVFAFVWDSKRRWDGKIEVSGTLINRHWKQAQGAAVLVVYKQEDSGEVVTTEAWSTPTVILPHGDVLFHFVMDPPVGAGWEFMGFGNFK